jgi:hypothetical protein
MHPVQLADQVYQEAQRRATEAGFASVDDYIADVVIQDVSDSCENLDHYFTPERLAHIDKALAQVDAGNYFTEEQAKAELGRRRARWIETR